LGSWPKKSLQIGKFSPRTIESRTNCPTTCELDAKTKPEIELVNYVDAPALHDERLASDGLAMSTELFKAVHLAATKGSVQKTAPSSPIARARGATAKLACGIASWALSCTRDPCNRTSSHVLP